MEIISFEKRHLRKFQPSWITSCRGWKPSAIAMTKRKRANGWTVIPYAGSCVSVREHYRLSVTMGRLPLLKSETVPITVLKTWNV